MRNAHLLRVFVTAAITCHVFATDCTIPSSGVADCGTVVAGDLLLPSIIPQTIDLGNITTIDGSFVIENTAMLQTVSGSLLTLIGENFTMGNVTQLSRLSFPALSQVGAINFTGTSSLQLLDFGDPGIQRVSSVLVTNTQLRSLAGLDFIDVDTVNINNNPYLSDINLHTNTINVGIDIGANDVTGSGTNVTMPNLTSAATIIFRNITSLSLPYLKSTNNFTLAGNEIVNLVCPQLSQIGQSGGGGFSVIDNPLLKSIQMLDLTQSDGLLSVTNNTILQTLSGFQNLSDIDGDAVFNGNFSSIHLPALQNIHGNLNVTSTDDSLDCSPFLALKSNGTVLQNVTCQGLTDSTVSPTSSRPGSSTTPSSTPSSDPEQSTRSSTLGTGGKVGVGVGVSTAVVICTIGPLLLERRRRRKKRSQKSSLPNKAETSDFSGKPELSAESYVREADGRLVKNYPHELHAPVVPVEMPSENPSRQELSGGDVACQIGTSDEVWYSEEIRRG